jgi:uncharacterized protein (TIGR02001 family)
MMNRTIAASAVVAACLGLFNGAAADVLALPVNSSDAPAGTTSSPVYTFSVTAASNYIFRGVSQTENNFTGFGLARGDYEDFYAAAGMEHVDFHNSIDAEYDLYLGWKPSIYDFNFDLGAVRWGYVDEPSHVSIDTVELKGAVSHTFGPATLGAVVYFAPDYFGTGHNGTYTEGNATYAVIENLSASAAVGYQRDAVGTSHAAWNVGADYTIMKHFTLDVRYYDTDGHELGKLYNSHFVVAIKAAI